MKLEITKSLRLARPEVWLPHHVFKVGEIVDTDDEYIIENLLQLKCAKKTKKNADEKPAKKKEEDTKSQKVAKNKMQEVPEDKSFLDSDIDLKDLDIEVD